jgi:uncharacterized protein (DUF1800 family)
MVMTGPVPTAMAAHALARFGFGAGTGDLARISDDPKGWVAAQLEGPPPGLPPQFTDHPGSAPRLLEVLAVRKLGQTDEAMARRKALQEAYRSDIVTRTRIAATSDRPLIERLVQFWSNHFTVSTQRGEVAPLAVAFENEAIRPHVLGRFEDMARAAILHPAMLVYLDNAQSIGPDSKAGQKRKRGLNENLGREALELHTLGVHGGYDQDDVRALALILTGWTIDRQDGDGTAFFNPNTHEPGPKTLLGRTFPEEGDAEAPAAITLMANHKGTAKHVAVKLARHFIADDPPASAISALERKFRETGGDLAAVTAMLVRLDAAWADPLAKLRSPNDFLTATLRATQLPADDKQLANALNLLGQMPFAAPSPAGWPDRAADWAGPDAVVRRVDWSLALGQRAGGKLDARVVLADMLGNLADAELVQMVARAPSPAEALALALSSPAFQRR